MPNCDFYASPEDYGDLFTWLFAEGACDVYELYSEVGHPLKRFASTAEVMAQLERQYVTSQKWSQVHFQLYVLGAGPPFVARRIALNPQARDGGTYRYAANGLGLVQLYLGGSTQSGLENSHTNHNTQKRAETWAPSLKGLPDVASWDFKKITAFSSRLNREIKKFSVGKLNSRLVLPGALKLWQSGTSLLPYKVSDMTIKLHTDV
jgi:hypothetical protein